MKVLLVVRDSGVLEGANSYLKKENKKIEVNSVDSAEKALKLSVLDEIDVIISGYSLPGMDGLEFLKAVKDKTQGISFVVCLTEGSDDLVDEFRDQGADRCLHNVKNRDDCHSSLCQVLNDLVKEKGKNSLGNREKFRKLFDVAPDPAFLVKGGGILEEVNEAYCEKVGYEKEEIEGFPLRELPFFPEESLDKLMDSYEKRLEGQKVLPYIVEVVTKEGRRLKLEINARRLMDNNEPIGTVGIARDVTERITAQNRFENLFNSIPDSAIFIEGNGKIAEINEVMCQRISADREDVLGKTVKEFIGFLPEKVRERLLARFEKTLSEGHVKPQMVKYETGGETRYVEINSVRANIGGGEPGVIGIIRDITDRRKANELFRAFFEAISDMAFILNEDGVVEQVNKSYCDFHGYDKDELIGRSLEELPEILSEEDREKTLERFNGFMEGKDLPPLTVEYFTKGGESRFAEMRSVPLRRDGVEGVIGIARDITERKRMEEALRESEERYRKTIKNANVGIGLYGPSGDVQITNKRVQEISGYSKEELSNLDGWFEKVYPDPDVRDRIRKEWQRRMSEDGYVKDGEAVIQTKDGEKKTLLFNSVRLDCDDSLVFLRDITERKQAEEREEFLHSLLRHDLRNKIQIAQGYCGLLEEIDLKEEELGYIDKLKMALSDGFELVEKVRNLRRIGKDEIGVVDLSLAIEGVVKRQTPYTVDRGINIKVGDIDAVVEGGSLLKELFSNIIENSIFHSSCSRINISTSEVDGELVVSIQDDGEGIPDDIKEKVFEKGFKDVESSGSGLGLFLAREIVRDYGGSIEVENSEMGGAQFRVYLKKC